MKGDGLKVTLVRVPNLSDLPEEKKHQRVLQVLRSMNATKSIKKKPIASINCKVDPTMRETANISPVDSALQDLTAGSALHGEFRILEDVSRCFCSHLQFGRSGSTSRVPPFAKEKKRKNEWLDTRNRTC